MHYRQHHKLISHHAKIDRERKSADNQTACLSMNAGMSERTCDNARDSLINSLAEGLPEPSTL